MSDFKQTNIFKSHLGSKESGHKLPDGRAKRWRSWITAKSQYLQKLMIIPDTARSNRSRSCSTNSCAIKIKINENVNFLVNARKATFHTRNNQPGVPNSQGRPQHHDDPHHHDHHHDLVEISLEVLGKKKIKVRSPSSNIISSNQAVEPDKYDCEDHWREAKRQGRRVWTAFCKIFQGHPTWPYLACPNTVFGVFGRIWSRIWAR